MKKLGNLEKVALRDVWPKEASDFTPWLASEYGLCCLGQELGIKLDLVGTEVEVGRYSADVVCRGVDDDSVVLIENQITESDHTHLGQILTYSAEFEPATVVWISSSFTDEHKKAIEWLNSISHEKSDFFGVTIETWKIDESSPAPKFNVVVHPQNWSKQNPSPRPRVNSSPLKRAQKDFWTGFVELVNNGNYGFRTPSALALNEMILGAGRTNIQFRTWIGNTQDGGLHVALYITGENRLTYFEQLKERCEEIETDLGLRDVLIWRPGRDDKSYYIQYSNPGADFGDQSDWQQQHRWLANTLERFYAVFPPIVKNLKT